MGQGPRPVPGVDPVSRAAGRRAAALRSGRFLSWSAGPRGGGRRGAGGGRGSPRCGRRPPCGPRCGCGSGGGQRARTPRRRRTTRTPRRRGRRRPDPSGPRPPPPGSASRRPATRGGSCPHRDEPVTVEALLGNAPGRGTRLPSSMGQARRREPPANPGPPRGDVGVSTSVARRRTSGGGRRGGGLDLAARTATHAVSGLPVVLPDDQGFVRSFRTAVAGR